MTTTNEKYVYGEDDIDEECDCARSDECDCGKYIDEEESDDDDSEDDEDEGGEDCNSNPGGLYPASYCSFVTLIALALLPTTLIFDLP